MNIYNVWYHGEDTVSNGVVGRKLVQSRVEGERVFFNERLAIVELADGTVIFATPLTNLVSLRMISPAPLGIQDQ